MVGLIKPVDRVLCSLGQCEPDRVPREIDEYTHWPSADWWDYSSVREEYGKFDGYAVVYAGDRLDRTAQLKPAMYLRGMEQIYLDLHENPAVAEAVISHIKGYLRRVHNQHCAQHPARYARRERSGSVRSL